MKKVILPFIFFSCLILLLLLSGCTGYSGSSVHTSVGYGVYSDYSYPYRYGYYDDVYEDRRNEVKQRRQQFKDNRPERQQAIQSARSRSASMGRPVGGRRAGRR